MMFTFLMIEEKSEKEYFMTHKHYVQSISQCLQVKLWGHGDVLARAIRGCFCPAWGLRASGLTVWPFMGGAANRALEPQRVLGTTGPIKELSGRQDGPHVAIS